MRRIGVGLRLRARRQEGRNADTVTVITKTITTADGQVIEERKRGTPTVPLALLPVRTPSRVRHLRPLRRAVHRRTAQRPNEPRAVCAAGTRAAATARSTQKINLAGAMAGLAMQWQPQRQCSEARRQRCRVGKARVECTAEDVASAAQKGDRRRRRCLPCTTVAATPASPSQFASKICRADLRWAASISSAVLNQSLDQSIVNRPPLREVKNKCVVVLFCC